MNIFDQLKAVEEMVANTPKRKVQTFEDFLKEKWFEDFHGTKDQAEDAEMVWFENLHTQEVMDYAQEWGNTLV